MLSSVNLSYGEGEGEVSVFSAKRWDRRSIEALVESAQMVGPYWVSNLLHVTVLTVRSKD